MSRLTWDDFGKRLYELGVDRGVLYVGTAAGVAWAGLISVPETSAGGTARPFYLDGIKYLNLASAEEYAATINSFASPPEFGPCDGSLAIHNGLFATQQPRSPFGLTYRTLIGNDAEGTEYAYKIHVVYNALAEPSQRANKTTGDSMDPDTYSWAITTQPPTFTGFKPTAHFVVDSRFTSPLRLSAFEDILYGSDTAASSLPLGQDLVDWFSNNDFPLLKAVLVGVNTYEFYEVDPLDARAVMGPTAPTTPGPGEPPMIWFDTSSGPYGIPKLVMEG